MENQQSQMAEPWPSCSSSSRGKKKRPRSPNDDATSSQVRTKNSTRLEDELIFSDTLIALQLMRTQFPKLEKVVTQPFILQSQLYSSVKDRTQVDRDLESLKKDRVLRVFKLNTGQDDHAIMFMDDYLKQMQKFKTLAKALTGKTVTAGRNSSGRITSFHRGGGSKRSLRDIDLKRNTCSVGIVERIEYDPNRSSRIALLRWIEGVGQKDPAYKAERAPVNYIIASHQMEPGSMVVNSDSSKPSTTGSLMRPAHNADSFLRFQELFRKASQGEEGTDDQAKDAAVPTAALLMPADLLDLNSKVGNCMPLSDIRMGTWVHSIELRHGQGAKLVRAAGAYAKVVKESATQCLVRLPSGVEKLIDSRCRATIGIVSNPTHGARKLRKAGHSRWLGRRPTVRGVAMNPVDHPHGGGEGRTKGGRPSVSPWGKPTKAGYRTVPKKPKAQLSRD